MIDEATLALIVGETFVLLGEKKVAAMGGGLINGPGGKIEAGETPEACLLRETEEELCVRLDPRELRHQGTLLCHEAGEAFMRVQVFRTERILYGTPYETESMRPYYALRDCLPYNRMHEADVHWFGRMVRGERFNANIYYTGKGVGFLSIDFLPYTPLA